MHTVTLSDHPAEMLADAVSERRRGSAAQQVALDDARKSRDQAWAQRRWFRWLRLYFTVRRAARELARQRLSAERPTGREDSIRAGRAAEQRVADDLGRALNADWTLFRGYRNRRGEIDGLLLGPSGLFAYEVKYHNATVHISGDDWQSEKFDRYGNQVSDRAPMTDRRGRSPARQLSEPAAALADWLAKRGHPVVVTPMVLLTHERARIGSIRRPTVDVETSVQALLGLAQRASGTLNARKRAAIAQLIRDDHRHHERR
jgi:hypothetical protein